MKTIRENLNLLGFKGVDKVTGMKGVVTSVSFDLYGCVQLLLNPAVDLNNNKLANPYWFDEDRIRITGRKPVMTQPKFAMTKGPADKPVHI